MAINKRISLLALTILLTFLAAALIAALTFGGGAKRTVASRSAAAFREAQRRGELTGEMSGKGGMAGHGMAQTEPPSPAGRGGQREAPAGGHAGMQHGGAAAPPAGSPAGGHAGMQQGGATAAGTPSDPMAGAPVVPPPQPKAAEASQGQPAGTLRPDPLDQPVETSVVEARRSAEMNQEMGGGQGMQHGMSSYRQLDAGRDSSAPVQGEGSVAPGSPTSPDHRGMQHGSTPAAPPSAPATTKPPPSRPTPSAPRPEPTPPPHHSGGHDEGTRHSEATR